jgi:hypothetical protein
MENIDFNSQTIITIVTGILLAISEILPFISKIESNGLICMLVNMGKAFLDKNKVNIELPESQHLLEVQSKVPETKINFGTLDLQIPSNYELYFIISYIKKNYTKGSLSLKDLTENNKILLVKNGYIVIYWPNKILPYLIGW